jgi:asparagine synthetase B (glutamine-hydrolysing)
MKVKNLHKYDCLRANKSMLAWGVEARVPFLDREFLEYAMNLDPSVKMVGLKDGKRIEKFVVRCQCYKNIFLKTALHFFLQVQHVNHRNV